MYEWMLITVLIGKTESELTVKVSGVQFLKTGKNNTCWIMHRDNDGESMQVKESCAEIRTRMFPPEKPKEKPKTPRVEVDHSWSFFR